MSDAAAMREDASTVHGCTIFKR